MEANPIIQSAYPARKNRLPAACCASALARRHWKWLENYHLSPARIVGLLFLILFISAITRPACGEIAVPPERETAPIRIAAESAYRWQEGGYEVWLLQGACQISQGNTIARSTDAVIWLDLPSDTDEDRKEMALVYLEGDVEVRFQHDGPPSASTGESAQIIRDQQWLGRFYSYAGINADEPPLVLDVQALRGKPATDLPIIRRGKSYRRNDLIGQVQPVQWTAAVDPAGLSEIPAELNGDSGNDWPSTNENSSVDRLAQIPGSGTPMFTAPFGPQQMSASQSADTRVRFLPRGSRAPSLKSFPSAGGTEQVWIATGGVKVVVESEQLSASSQDLNADSRVVIEADEVVAWTNSLAQMRVDGQPVGQSDKRWELYLEGNIVFATGRRVVYADQMYYDTLLRRGTILNAELLTPVPEYEGLVRLKADVLQQLNENTFQAYGAAVTSSRLGVPRYWIQSNDVRLTQTPQNRVDPATGQFIIDPQTGLPEVEPNYLINSRGNQVYLGQTPVFYWPTFTTDLKRSNYYLNNIAFKNDSVFGTQVLTEFDLYQLLGIQNPPRGTAWTLDADYLSDRGPALGTNYKYGGTSPLGLAGPYFGELDVWGIHDEGLDNLGLDRRALAPDQTFRGRGKFKHRQRFGDGYQFTAEAGYISDRNFLEQYYEQEWDWEKDQVTALQLKRLTREHSFNVEGSIRLNDFFTQTESLPRFDHFMIGRSILFDRATWHTHSQVGYQRMRVASDPKNPIDQAKFTRLPWEADVEGLAASTRQEIDVPLELGPIKAVPYLLGEASYWGEDLTGSSFSRTFGQAGVRSSLPIWRADNSVQSELFNVNGLAHKVNFETDIFYANASEDLTQLPLYNPLDDDAQEAFRRRFTFDTFGGLSPGVPFRFDPRSYALRSGLQSSVASPSTEVAGDLFASKFSINQRWQTKRGLPGNERIIDWVTLDVSATYFPDANRDNFGTDVGLLDYEFRWHVGDRVSILSDGFFDFFGQGLRTGSVGVLLSRPEVGNLYVGFRSIEGPISSNVWTSSYNYRMSEKWILTAGSSVDLSSTGNIGQRLVFTRIGESFLLRFGVNNDVSRGNLGFVFGLEPRFYSQSRSTNLGGVPLPAVGARGLE
jgi:hypothetical protein